MSYPQFLGKHQRTALFSPLDFIQYKQFLKKMTIRTLPKKYLLIYNHSTLNYFKRRYKPKKISLYSLLTIWVYRDIGVIKMTGIGSPNAAVIMEELIALGGKVFLNVGTAGGLHHEGVFLCAKALRDEGTSHHYLKPGKFAFPDKGLTKQFGESIKKQELEFSEGVSWTIDAPYRETKEEVQRYLKQGISTVEMETAALCAVATYRKVKIAAAFVVSDLLGKKWLPKFHRFDVKKTQNLLIDAAVDCLQSMKQ